MGRFGAHMSIAGGLPLSIERAIDLKLDTLQIFSKNQRQWKAPPLKDEEADAFISTMRGSGLYPLVCHDSYLINLGNPREEPFLRSVDAFTDELVRADRLEVDHLVMHPGSPLKSGEEAGLDRIVKGLDLSWSGFEEKGDSGKIMVLLEATAGQGTNLGYTFEQLARIKESVSFGERVGVCFDTCHVYASGYDIKTPEGYEDTMNRFDDMIGLSNLKAFHLNDSIKGLGSRVDRHTHIGEGTLGPEPFGLIVNDGRFGEIPMILETPGGEVYDRKNLALLRGLVRGSKQRC